MSEGKRAMTKLYDAIVVGAGPAGLLAAKAAAENGLNVALLERKKQPERMHRSCGQTLISMNEYYFGNLVNYNIRDKLICFSSDGFSFRYDGPVQNIYNLAIYTPKGHPVEFGNLESQRGKGDFGRVGLTFDKEELSRSLLSELRKCHVDIFPHTYIERTIIRNDRVYAEGSGQSFEGSYLIAADGSNSKIAHYLGLNQSRIFYCNAIGISYYVSNVVGLRPDQVVRTSNYLPDGAVRTYFVPRPIEGEFNIVCVTVDPRCDMKAAGEIVLKEGLSGKWLAKARVLRTFTAVASCYSPIQTPYKDRVLVIGDAAGTQELEITGAMLSGWKAGQAVSTAVLENKIGMESSGVNQYLSWWKKTYIDFYSYDAFMKGNCFPYILTNGDEYEYVFGLLRETLPATWNPYSSPTAEAMRRVMPVIQQERPEVLAKLLRRKLPATELLADITKISKPVIGEDEGT
jgi:flavin-dependent dehydrogenase